MRGARVNKNAGMLNLMITIFAALSLVLIIRTGIVIGDDQTLTTTLLNVTGAGPVITAVTINGGTNVNLTEGSTYRVLCNVSVREFNGISDIVSVNGTFFRTNVSENSSDNNESRYFNSSCFSNGSVDANNHWFECSYDVYFYAYNGTWNCSAIVVDAGNASDYEMDQTEIVPLYAMNITSQIDYGNLTVGQTSSIREANITNFGNQFINISVYGYGGNNSTSGANLSFVCPFNDNISIGYERYSWNNTTAWVNMTNLSWNATLVPNITIIKQKDGGDPVVNTTYWALQIPPNPTGLCNGTVVFEALAP